MEVIVEFIVEVLFEGLIEFGTAQEAPKTLRGICLTVVTASLLGFGGFCGYYAIVAATNIVARVVFGFVALLMLAGCIGFWYKVFKKRKSQNNK